MLRIWLVALVACGGDDAGPHDVVECDATWDMLKAGYPDDDVTCERACETTPPAATEPCVIDNGDSCPTNLVAVDQDGVRGCCSPHAVAAGERRVTFFECE